ncbi:hypothetical protein [Streptomyces bambusae]|uniref:Uncharacterized protein n=1 Tax=Streptomyces bambusae TaxID=1550616 RepID=A0ABS6Z4B0_9ACTN|nr:hypothetical protein [Streptomyces bambusae]MBW5482603.1 hypothetical protein [Streptomyces bambusae]
MDIPDSAPGRGPYGDARGDSYGDPHSDPDSYEVYAEGVGLFAALGLGFLAFGGWLLTTTRPWSRGFDLEMLLGGWGMSLLALLCGLVLTAGCVLAALRPLVRADASGLHLADRFHAAWRDIREVEIGTVELRRDGREPGAGTAGNAKNTGNARNARNTGYAQHRALWVTLRDGRRHEYVTHRPGEILVGEELRDGLCLFAGDVPVSWSEAVVRRPRRRKACRGG